MKKLLTKIKLSLATLWITLISFSSKAMGWIEVTNNQPINLSNPKYIKPPKSTIILVTITKILPRILIAITFIIWIVSFIKIRKIDDENLKKKKIKNTIIIISIHIILIIATFLISAHISTELNKEYPFFSTRISNLLSFFGFI